MRSEFSAFMDLVMAMIIVGSSVALGRYLIRDADPNAVLLLRFVLAAPFLAPFLVKGWSHVRALAPRHWLLLAVQALCGAFLFNVFLLEGMRDTDAVTAGVITSATPATMAVLSWLLLRESMGRNTAIGVILATIGLMVINVAGASGGVEWSPRGAALLFLAVLCETVFLLLRKKIPSDVPAMTVAALIGFLGLLWFLPVGVGPLLAERLAGRDAGFWIAIGYYALGVSGAAYFFWFRGVAHVPAGKAGVITAVMPVSALVFAWLLLGEIPTLVQAVGGALVIAGILFIAVRNGRTKNPAQARQGQDASREGGKDKDALRAEAHGVSHVIP